MLVGLVSECLTFVNMRRDEISDIPNLKLFVCFHMTQYHAGVTTIYRKSGKMPTNSEKYCFGSRILTIV